MERGGTLDAAAAAGLIDWWVDAGVDCLVDETPRDWLKPAPAPALPSAKPGAPLAAPAAPAEVLPDQLPLFREWLAASETLPYAAPAAPRLCPSGDPGSGLMILVPMPSSEDCTAGALISGAAGRLFDRMLAAIGRSRETIYLAGLSCFRPPTGRLDADGARRCADIARHHLALVKPRAVLLMGDASAKAMIGLGAAQARGRPHAVETPAGPVEAIVTLHPDYLLAQPAAKALAWADLQLLMERLR